MSRKIDAVTLTILGKEYKIACELNEQDDLIEAARQLDSNMRKMRDSGKVNGADRIAVLAALNLAHELQIVKNQNVQLSQNLARHLADLRNKINQTLDD
ncbi:MAG: cell division protein ZapA [Methylococcaceae bacterium]